MTHVRDTGWFKSSFSGGGNDNCVETRFVSTGGLGGEDARTTVHVRDSKNTSRSFEIPSTGWLSLVRGLTGE